MIAVANGNHCWLLQEKDDGVDGAARVCDYIRVTPAALPPINRERLCGSYDIGRVL